LLFLQHRGRRIFSDLPIDVLKGNTMGPYIRTHPSADHFFVWCALIVLVLTGTATAAQNGRANSNQGQAVLHIQAVVVPVVMLPSQGRRNEPRGPVTYDLGAAQPAAQSGVQLGVQLKMSVIEELRPLPQVFRDRGWGSNTGNVVLKTLTVVAQ
jgi:hypothetical protein